MGKTPIVSVTYEKLGGKDFIKKQLILLKMCVKSLLCSPRTDLWSLYGFLLMYKTLYIYIICRGYYTVARRYVFYFRVVK